MRKPIRYALIGFGGIGKSLVRSIGESAGAVCAAVLVRAPHHVSGAPEGAELVTDSSGLLAAQPDIVVECAGHAALRQFGADLLSAGARLVPASVGALADEALYEELRMSAEKGGGRLALPAGAIGGIDALSAARASGLHRVRYRGRKPPGAWRGTPAEDVLALDALNEPATHFSGTARDAAMRYPKNANVAATVALAGCGFDATEVELIADPSCTDNVHEIEVEAEAGSFAIRLVGRPSPDNPSTSMLTSYSLARLVLNEAQAVAI
ncbi:MAG: aspartate dehydrogenase [Pseudomonadota bacterium]